MTPTNTSVRLVFVKGGYDLQLGSGDSVVPCKRLLVIGELLLENFGGPFLVAEISRIMFTVIWNAEFNSGRLLFWHYAKRFKFLVIPAQLFWGMIQESN